MWMYKVSRHRRVIYIKKKKGKKKDKAARHLKNQTFRYVHGDTS